MKEVLFDSLDIIPEMRRRRRSSIGSGIFRAIGGFFRSISMAFMFGIAVIIALILFPFILIRNRRSAENDVLEKRYENFNNSSFNQYYSSAASKDKNDKVDLKK